MVGLQLWGPEQLCKPLKNPLARQPLYYQLSEFLQSRFSLPTLYKSQRWFVRNPKKKKGRPPTNFLFNLKNSNMLLQKFSEQARQAHYHTSFSPERRGESMVAEFSQQLQEDIAELEKAGIESSVIGDYQERYERLFSSWLGAKSRCISSMITGPARFPVRRAEKANRSEQNHYDVFQEWRKRAKKSIVRKAQPAKTYESEIDRYKLELKDRVRTQDYMKIINESYRKYKKNPACLDSLKIHSEAKEYVRNWVPPYSYVKQPFTYQLQNNLQNIKRIEARIADLEKMEEAKQAVGGEKEIEFEGGVVVLNYELDRVQIKYPGKPKPEVIASLKSGGFRWAPSQQAWQRQLTGNGLRSASYLTGLKF